MKKSYNNAKIIVENQLTPHSAIGRYVKSQILKFITNAENRILNILVF